MQRIALAMALTALAAPASAFTSGNPNTATNDLGTTPSSAALQAVDTGEFGPIHAWWGQRLEAFKKRQANDQGGTVDDARYRNRNDERKRRNLPRRQYADPGDLGGRGPDPGNAGDPSKK